MTIQTTSPYGSWTSPITADMIISNTKQYIQYQLVGEMVYWLEGRPMENGRQVIVQHHLPTGKQKDLTPSQINVRTRVHEYGGGHFKVYNDAVYFSNFSDQRLYQLMLETGALTPVTPELSYRYADGAFSAQLAVYVREDHTADGEPVNTLVSLALDGADAGTVLASGHDFYASPTFNVDGTKLAWLAWSHPNMPWDGTELWCADVVNGTLQNAHCVAGGLEESIYQPLWGADGKLYFVSDRNNWWNIYCLHDGTIVPVLEMEAEFGVPQWVFGSATMVWETAVTLLTRYTQNGLWHLGRLNVQTGAFETIPLPEITNISTMPNLCHNGQTVLMVGSPNRTSHLVTVDLQTHQIKPITDDGAPSVDTTYISAPQPIEFPTSQERTAYALYYPPTNPDIVPPTDEKPPLRVLIHGGPTGSAKTSLQMGIQYWTSRGFAVVDVNYGGSTGYGRAYRQRLNKQWGIVDVEDCIQCAHYLASQGWVDPQKLTIEGGSAGGYTVLCALTFHNQFSAGASYFGISDLEALAQETHKFESRYVDSLIGKYPEEKEIYQQRSPINFVDQISTPLILLQGLEDKVVPPNQSEMMFEAVKAKGIPVAYVPFEGEQHGFRQAKNIKRSLEAELYFYSQVLGFPLAEEIEPVEIENLA